jgi:hypothetical protein
MLADLPKSLSVTEIRGKDVKGAHVWKGLGLGASHGNVPWNPRQWASILSQAGRLALKPDTCTPLEYWVWWCYPVFARYEWNTREVLDAACQREFTEWPDGIDQLTKFRRHWMSCGLRFPGKKQKRDRTPPLAEFVEKISLPDSGNKELHGVPVWSRYVTKKN